MALSKEEILARGKNRKVMPVAISQLEGEVFIRRMSGADRDSWDLWQLAHSYSEEEERMGLGKSGRIKEGTTTLRSMFAVRVLSDEAGKRLFQDKDATALSELDAEVLDIVWDKGHEHNGIGKAAAEKIAKNSEAAASDDSGSSSPDTLESPSPSVIAT